MENEMRLMYVGAMLEAIKTFRDCYAASETEVNKLIIETANTTLNMVESFVKNAPTVDAVEVEHGYWIDSHTVDHIGRIIEHGIDCSVCDSVFKDDSREVVKHWKERFKVCPFCGAIMDGDGNE